MRLSYLKFIKLYFLLMSLTFSTEIDSSFSLKWQNEPWGAGGLIPAGPAWNMVGPYDFDNECLVLVPALILVYALTVWVEGKIFKEESVTASISKPVIKKAEQSTKGFK